MSPDKIIKLAMDAVGNKLDPTAFPEYNITVSKNFKGYYVEIKVWQTTYKITLSPAGRLLFISQ